MRISDWSSDVCSSDLHRSRPGWREGGQTRSQDRQQRPADRRHLLRRRFRPRRQSAWRAREGPAGRTADADLWPDRHRRGRPDRTSVVKGKSVSVWVDIGGRSSIKKKKNKTTEK